MLDTSESNNPAPALGSIGFAELWSDRLTTIGFVTAMAVEAVMS